MLLPPVNTRHHLETSTHPRLFCGNRKCKHCARYAKWDKLPELHQQLNITCLPLEEIWELLEDSCHTQAVGKDICKKKSAVQSKFFHILSCVALSCSLHFVLWPTIPLWTIMHIWEICRIHTVKLLLLTLHVKWSWKSEVFADETIEWLTAVLKAGSTPGHALLLPALCWLWHLTDYRNLFTWAQQRLRRVDVFGQFSELIKLNTYSGRLNGRQLHACPTRRADLLKGVQCKHRGRRSIFPSVDGFSYLTELHW